MPGTSDSRLETIHLKAHLDAARKIAALQRNGQQIWSNAQHQRISQAGLHVEDGTYGHWYFDANTQAPVLKHGEQDDGTFGQWSLDDSGNEIVKLGQIKINGTIYYGMALLNASNEVVALLGQLLDGNYGVALYNVFGVPIAELNTSGLTIKSGSGTERAQLGLLSNGDYGLLVQNTDGSSQEVLPTISAFAATQIETTSTSWTSLTGSPSLTATLGASGDAIVTIGGQIANGSTSAAGGGAIGLSVDGGAPTAYNPWTSYFSPVGGGYASVSQKMTLSAMQYTPGPGAHTFALRYQAVESTGALFSTISLVVEPI